MHAEVQLVFQPCPICACTPSPTTIKNYTAQAGYYTVLHLPCNLLLHCSFAGKMLFRMFVISFHPLISYVLTTEDLQRGFKYQMKSVWCQEPWKQRWWEGLLEQLLSGCTAVKRHKQICSRGHNDSRSSTDSSLIRRWSNKWIETNFSIRSPRAKMVSG